MNVIQLANEEFLPLVCQLVDEGKHVSINLKGNSMRPFIESDRDVGVLSKSGEYKRGDVVLAEIERGHFVLHRIDSICENNTIVSGPCKNPCADIILRGDGNVSGTERCKLSDIRALCGTVVRKGKPWNLHTSKVWKAYSWWWTHTLSLRKYQLAAYRLFWLGQWPDRWKKLSPKNIKDEN